MHYDRPEVALRGRVDLAGTDGPSLEGDLTVCHGLGCGSFAQVARRDALPITPSQGRVANVDGPDDWCRNEDLSTRGASWRCPWRRRAGLGCVWIVDAAVRRARVDGPGVVHAAAFGRQQPGGHADPESSFEPEWRGQLNGAA